MRNRATNLEFNNILSKLVFRRRAKRSTVYGGQQYRCLKPFRHLPTYGVDDGMSLETSNALSETMYYFRNLKSRSSGSVSVQFLLGDFGLNDDGQLMYQIFSIGW